MTQRYSTDIVIFGGGIAGCWLLNKLVNEGYNAVLFEQDGIGNGQTLASQGIIHGGLKYALNGALSGATNAIANMPERWRACLAGDSDVDLRGVNVLSDSYYMWSSAGIRSKLKTFLGSKSLRGRVESLDAADYPEFFSTAKVAGSLYKLPDFVVETESVLATLIAAHKQRIYHVTSDLVSFQRDDSGNVNTVIVETESGQLLVNTKRTIFAAGKGNQALIHKANIQSIKMQLRPLNMVYIKGKDLPPLFVHCIGDSFSLTPKLTITSHRDAGDNTVWYLGGEVAESGVDKSDAEQITSAGKLLSELFPWLDLTNVTWDCLAIDRAEPAVNLNFRPDDAFIAEEDGVIVAWPTKLTLTPSLGDMVSALLVKSAVIPTEHSIDAEQLVELQQAKVAIAPWN